MMSHRHLLARYVLLAVAAAALVGVPASSAAERPPRPDETAAAAVYREFIPTAVGARPSVESSSPAAGIPLSSDASAAVSEVESAEGKALEKVATSPRYGAPERRLPPRADTAVREAVPSTFAAVSTTESGRLVALALALLAVTALLSALAFRRRRLDRRA